MHRVRSVGRVPRGWRDTCSEHDQYLRHPLTQTWLSPARSQAGQAVVGGFAQEAVLPLAGEEVPVVGKHQLISIRYGASPDEGYVLTIA